MNYVRHVMEYFGHEVDVWKIAHLLNLEIKVGPRNYLVGRTIFVTREDYYSKRAARIIRHEIAHHLIRLSGGEDQILYLRGCYEEGLPTVENLCYHAALVLQIPEPLLLQAHAEMGNTPECILRIAELAGVSVIDALYRWVYAEVGAKRAAWIIRGSTVVEVAQSGNWLPFWKYSEVEDPCDELPNALLYPLAAQETLGVVSW